MMYRPSDKVSWACILSSYHPARPMIPDLFGCKERWRSLPTIKIQNSIYPNNCFFSRYFERLL